MMRRRWNSWLSGVGGVVLIGGLVLSNYGGGIMPAEAHDHERDAYYHPNPFKQIMDKLNEILAKLKDGAGAGAVGGGAGNHTLRWDAKNASASRFTVLADFVGGAGGAVLDNNTGLVWEQSPDTINTYMWGDARIQCADKNVGGARGWRLPSLPELTSLIDPSLLSPFVPTNVFRGVQSLPYWSATTNADNTNGSSKWSVNFQDGLSGYSGKGSFNYVWCVRGPMQESAY